MRYLAKGSGMPIKTDGRVKTPLKPENICQPLEDKVFIESDTHNGTRFRNNLHIDTKYRQVGSLRRP